ncbi:trypsin-like peptidase domain-containing protein [Desulfosporosinus acididurans]|uniref:trypsin-like peptidase domain-containing protein n=1 Tax=Desulfosporosinus acididurans TaxID=476652 RepID=UPI0006496AD9|nr:trypsin-like peptidase domain-containing protein [Desulfosporosinus acididurans]
MITSFLYPVKKASADFDREQLKKSVFKVYVDYLVNVDGLGAATISVHGTTFAIGKKGEKIKYLITNYHVMDQNKVIQDVAKQIVDALQAIGRYTSIENVAKYVHIEKMHPYIMLYDAPIDIKLTKAMEVNDLAVIEIVNDNERLNVDPLVFGDPNTVKTGDKVYAYGFPGIVDQLNGFYLGRERATARPSDVSYTNGEVNQKTQISVQGSYPLDVIHSTVPISGGNSGGPLVNENGYVIGINTYGSTQGNNYNVAMVPTYLLSLLDNIGISYEKTNGSRNVSSSSFIGKLTGNPIVILAAVVLIILIILAIVLIAINTSRKKNKVNQVETLPQNPIQNNPVQNNLIHNQPKPLLIGVSGHFAGNNLSVHGALIIGRDPAQCQVVFPANNTDISRRHSCLSYNSDAQSFVLEDLNSSNGTYLFNGQRVIPGQPHYLKSGEKFYLGVPNNMFEVRV